MDIRFFCPRWGSENIEWPEWLQQVQDAGYDGIEWAIANNTSRQELEKVFSLTQRMGIPVIVQHFQTNDSDFVRHCETYVQWFEKLNAYQFIKINSQTGKDYFSFEENKQLIALAGKCAQAIYTPIVHETHRGKFSFAAHVTKCYLQMLPELRLTLDASHWVNVAESLLDDQPDAMQMAIERTDHIHARVGYPEGPQVSDPRAKEWEEALQKHLGWWDEVVKIKKATNEDLTISPEFGPFPYMVHDPLSRLPVGDQWLINIHIMQLLRKRYA